MSRSTRKPPQKELNQMVEVGRVAPEIFAAIQDAGNRTDELLKELGRMELKKATLVSELRRLDSQRSALIRQEAERLGIPEGSPWQLTPEGKALAPESGLG